nr:reverse transcriptase domain-containing protein [Tanacetum cinerariifolium]
MLAVVEEEGHTWITPIHEYLVEEILPEEKKKARAVCHKAKRPLQENYALREIHDGSCSMYAGPRSVVEKALRSGAKRSLGEGIKTRLDERSKKWLEEISHVLWAHHTMIKSSNGETPFSLTYGTEAVIPIDIGMQTFRTTRVDIIKNDEALEEKREQAAIQEAKTKPKWKKNTIIPGFVTQASGRETLSTETTKQAMQKKEASSDLSGKDHMKS